MEQNKIESQFKVQLNSREIKPSELAWDKLNAMLSDADPYTKELEKRKTKPKYIWLCFAASFVGFLLLGTVFMNQKEITIDTNKKNIVIKNAIQIESSKDQMKASTKELNVSKLFLEQNTEAVVQAKSPSKSDVYNPLILSKEKELKEIQPSKSIETTIEIETQTNGDALLASVDVNLKSEIKKSTIKINAAHLLNQVDSELQVSFREKIFNTIAQKYNQAKEVVVDRNYE